MRVLIVEEPRPSEDTLRQDLEAHNFVVDVTSAGKEADSRVRGRAYDIVILDLMLPGANSLALLRGWRRDNIKTHVLALTSPDSATDRVRSLDSGADDCLTRPFELQELTARLRALIRRQYQVKDPVIRVHDLEIDTPRRTVTRGGQAIQLTRLEYALLELMAYRRGQVVPRQVIWDHLYGEQGRGTSNVVDVYIRYLRHKIDHGFHPPLILTRWGEGYLLRGD